MVLEPLTFKENIPGKFVHNNLACTASSLRNELVNIKTKLPAIEFNSLKFYTHIILINGAGNLILKMQ